MITHTFHPIYRQIHANTEGRKEGYDEERIQNGGTREEAEAEAEAEGRRRKRRRSRSRRRKSKRRKRRRRHTFLPGPNGKVRWKGREARKKR